MYEVVNMGDRKLFRRPRTTADVWYFYTNYGQGWEHECTEMSRKDAIAQQRSYAENCPECKTKIVKKRVRLAELN